jgi:cell division transport system ATP-binding protein
VIRFQQVFKAFPKSLALKDVTFQVGKGEFVFFTGHSGAGKSTILRMIYADDLPTSGSVIVSGMRTS